MYLDFLEDNRLLNGIRLMAEGAKVTIEPLRGAVVVAYNQPEKGLRDFQMLHQGFIDDLFKYDIIEKNEVHGAVLTLLGLYIYHYKTCYVHGKYNFPIDPGSYNPEYYKNILDELNITEYDFYQGSLWFKNKKDALLFRMTL